MHINFVEDKDLVAGDVILCCSSLVTGKAEAVTDSKYSHAAISLGNGEIAESCSGGVKITSVQGLLEEYDHLAILRKPYIWSGDRIRKLRAFIDKAIDNEASFNAIGMKKYEERKS